LNIDMEDRLYLIQSVFYIDPGMSLKLPTCHWRLALKQLHSLAVRDINTDSNCQSELTLKRNQRKEGNKHVRIFKEAFWNR